MNYWDQFCAVWGGINLLVPVTVLLGILSFTVPLVMIIVGVQCIVNYRHSYFSKPRKREFFIGIALILFAPVILVLGIPLTNMVGLASGAF